MLICKMCLTILEYWDRLGKRVFEKFYFKDLIENSIISLKPRAGSSNDQILNDSGVKIKNLT